MCPVRLAKAAVVWGLRASSAVAPRTSRPSDRGGARLSSPPMWHVGSGQRGGLVCVSACGSRHVCNLQVRFLLHTYVRRAICGSPHQLRGFA